MEPHVLALFPLWYAAFLLSLTCHEAAHAWAARRGGDDTAYLAGQVSLNPVPHIQREPIGTILVPLLTYFLGSQHWMMGWASAPYDPDWERRYPRRAAWMALAGPGANFALVLIAAVSIRVGIAAKFFRMPQSASFTHIAAAATPGTAELLATFLSVLFVLNLVLGTFNLLPVPPLDGHTGITLLMGEETALRFLDWGRSGFGMIGILVAWIVYDKLFQHIFLLSLAALYPGSSWS